jgi:4-hydroxy 2-oxovalerate aldolase
MPNFEILDCTLRDGGYYNNWDFDFNLVQKYLSAISITGIRYIELGFRGFPRDQFMGACAYTTDSYINTLSINDNLILGVMVNASEILNCELSINDALNSLFVPKNKSRVSLVRIAVNFSGYSECKSIVEGLKNLGYTVGLNLMQSDGRASQEIEDVANDISTWNDVEVLYFADSLGNMNEKDVVFLVENLKKGWHGKLGIHTHNNKGAGLANSLKAIELGVDWIDSTIMGMGRGAGNTATETLLCEVMGNPLLNYTPEPIFDIILNEFSTLYNKYKWGPNLYYHLAAIYNVHPTYVQFMIGDARYTSSEIVSLLKRLEKKDARTFNKNLLSPLHQENYINGENNWDVKDFCQRKSVLLLGAGPSIRLYNNSLLNYVKSRCETLQVYSINAHKNFPDKHIKANIVVDEFRALVEKDRHLKSKLPIISPNSIKNILYEKNAPQITENLFGVKVNINTLDCNFNSCVIPYPIAFAYALMFAHSAGAKEILLAGFDGFDSNDPRQIEMVQTIELYNNRSDALKITSITPTNYPVNHGSLYAPSI